MQTLALVNETSTESEADAFNTAWAVDYQLRYQFGRAWPISARCIYLPKGVNPPRGSWVLHLADTIDDPQALGYHDEDGNEIPFARIGLQASLNDHTSASSVVSHEATEMLVDAHLDLSCIDYTNKRLYGYEVGDPVQGNDYDVGEPEGRPTGIAVADFVTPPWFDGNTHPDTPTSFRQAVKGPFTVAPKGYTGWLDLTNFAAGWQQSFGSERTSAPDGDDRFRQRAEKMAALIAGGQ